MTPLLERLAKVFVRMGGIAPREIGPLPTHDTMSSRWDEAVMACIYDENARRYLDYLGPRR